MQASFEEFKWKYCAIFQKELHYFHAFGHGRPEPSILAQAEFCEAKLQGNSALRNYRLTAHIIL
jgi:hypothetical protein